MLPTGYDYRRDVDRTKSVRAGRMNAQNVFRVSGEIYTINQMAEKTGKDADTLRKAIWKIRKSSDPTLEWWKL